MIKVRDKFDNGLRVVSLKANRIASGRIERLRQRRILTFAVGEKQHEILNTVNRIIPPFVAGSRSAVNLELLAKTAGFGFGGFGNGTFGWT